MAVPPPPSPTPPLQQEILIIKEYVWDYSFDNLVRDCIQDASTKHLIELGSGGEGEWGIFQQDQLLAAQFNHQQDRVYTML